MVKRVLLINQDVIPHYRVPIYGYLYSYLQKYDFELFVTAGNIQKGNPHPVNFPFERMQLSTANLLQLIAKQKVDAIIFWVNLKFSYLFPTILIAKILMRKKILYWGHGRDLEDPDATLKNLGYFWQHSLSDAIILYGEHLRKFLALQFQSKTFIANNTLVFPATTPSKEQIAAVRNAYKITTRRNIIFMGRVEKRKRVGDLIEAFRSLKIEDTGLIIVGPDPDGLLADVHDANIYRIGPVYGAERFALLATANVFCIPGHVGLSIVDAFWCGLPLVTEDVPHAPEIMYMKNGVNGIMVPKGNVGELKKALELLLSDEQILAQFSRAAHGEITTNGHIDKMCAGFKEALEYSFRQ